MAVFHRANLVNVGGLGVGVHYLGHQDVEGMRDVQEGLVHLEVES